MSEFSGVSMVCFAFAALLGATRGEDRILTHMCSPENGAKFWRDVMKCSPLLGSQRLEVLKTCIPLATYEEAERTRCSVCSKPDQWEKMMNCMHIQLIELQDLTNPRLEFSPDINYKACIAFLITEAEFSGKMNNPFLPENDRIEDSRAVKTY